MVFLYMLREASWHRPSILTDTFRMAFAFDEIGADVIFVDEDVVFERFS